MSGPQKSGVFIYGKEIERLASFYLKVISDAQKIYATADMVVINVPGSQLVIHKFPPDVESTLEMTAPPKVRASAIRPFYTVSSIDSVADTVAALGGNVLPEVYQGAGFKVSNAYDPEGNIFQIREFSDESGQ